MPWRYTVSIDADTNEAPRVIDDGDTIRVVYDPNANPRVHSTSGPTSFDDAPQAAHYQIEKGFPTSFEDDVL